MAFDSNLITHLPPKKIVLIIYGYVLDRYKGKNKANFNYKLYSFVIDSQK